MKTLNKQFLYIIISNDFVCNVLCYQAKMKKQPYPVSNSISHALFDLIHIDIWGPTNISLDGYKYFVTIVDDFSRYTWTVMIRQKGEASQVVKNFNKIIQVQFGKNIRTDNGVEYDMEKFYRQNGIVHQRSCVETPQQNGLVERKHQHILNVAISLKFQSKLPKTFWNYFIGHSVHLINRLPTPLLKNKSPYEVLYNKFPDYDSLRPFGCLCFFSSLARNRTKLDPRGIKGIFLSYVEGMKGF